MNFKLIAITADNYYIDYTVKAKSKKEAKSKAKLELQPYFNIKTIHKVLEVESNGSFKR